MEWLFSSSAKYKIKVLDYTYTADPSIYTAIPLHKSMVKTIFFIITTVLTLGLYWLIANWSARQHAWLLFTVCTLETATHFLIQEQQRVTGSQIILKESKYQLRIRRMCHSFTYNDRSYLYIEEKEVFVPVRYQQLTSHLDKLKNNVYVPIRQRTRQKLLNFYGMNVMRLEVQSIFKIFIGQMLTPFQVLQSYGIILWIIEDYYVFAIFLLVYSLYSYWSTANEVRKRQQTLAFESYFDIHARVLITEDESIELRKVLHEPDRPQAEFVEKEFNSLFADEKDANKFSARRNSTPPLTRSQHKEVSNQQNDIINDQDALCKEISSHRIVPGDLLILQEGDIVPCDCILIRGEALVIQQYTTGQSYLVRKKQLHNFTYNSEEESTCILYLGSEIVQTCQTQAARRPGLQLIENSFKIPKSKGDLVCLVTNTNYNTQRGKFLRQVRYQQKPRTKFALESIYFLLILFIFTLAVFIFLLIKLWELYKNETGLQIFEFFLDLLFTSIPPTLPTVLNIGIVFVQHALNKKGINCVLPSAIFAAGTIDTVILDADNLFANEFIVHGAVIGIKSKMNFGFTFRSLEQLQSYHDAGFQYSGVQDWEKKTVQKRLFLKHSQLFIAALSCCHTLQYYKGQMEGEHVQKCIFQFSKAKVLFSHNYQIVNNFLTIRKIFASKKIQKVLSAVVVIHKKQELKDQFLCFFVKGPSQKLLSMCDQNSYSNSAHQYIIDMAEKGFYLCCYAYLQVSQTTTEAQLYEILRQKRLIFLGFMIMQQGVVAQTKEAIQFLRAADVHIFMTTTKNQFQAASQAALNGICDRHNLLQCSMNKNVNGVCINGPIEWNSIGTQYLQEFVTQVSNFSSNIQLSLTSNLLENLKRQRPFDVNIVLQKTTILSQMQLKNQRGLYFMLQKAGNETLAVGKGGNVSQCASVSIQLNKKSSSQLSSFHTKDSNLLRVVDCLRICRAGLSTNFHGFKMIILFSLTQFTTTTVLATIYQSLTKEQSFFQDFFVTFPIYITITLTQPSSRLTRDLPSNSFFSVRNMLSMIGQLIIQLLTHIGFLLYLKQQIYASNLIEYTKLKALESKQLLDNSQITRAFFVLTNYLYLGISISTSVSKPFRKPFYTNPLYLINVILLWLYSTFIVFFPSLAPAGLRKFSSDQGEFMLLIALLLGNLVMLIMYLYQNLLFFIWTKDKIFTEARNLELNQGR